MNVYLVTVSDGSNNEFVNIDVHVSMKSAKKQEGAFNNVFERLGLDASAHISEFELVEFFEPVEFERGWIPMTMPERG